MGLGGYLTWTAVAREVRKRINNDAVKIIPLEQHGNFIKTVKSEIFFNNPDILQEWEDQRFCFPLVLNNPATNYCKKDTPERAVHRYDKHIIQQICEFYGIDDPELKCVLNLTDEENLKVSSLLTSNGVGKDFVAIDIGVNTNYNKNKFDDFEKWQKIVDKLSDQIQVVQVGLPGFPILDKTVNLTGNTTFREAAGIVGSSKCLLSCEGGLIHAATAFDIKSVAVTTSFLSPTMVAYPGNHYIWLNDDNHGPCGMKIKCDKCHENMLQLKIEEVVSRTIRVVEEN